MRAQKYTRLRFKTYIPEQNIHVGKEEALSWVGYLGLRFSQFNGLISVFASGVLGSIRAFFSAKDRVSEYRRKNEKVLEFRIKRAG